MSSPVLHLLATSLLHLGLPLACLRLRDTCSVLEAPPHARVGAPGGVGAVRGHDSPQQPAIVACDGGGDDAAVGPVDHVPHVLGQAWGIEVLARSLDGAIGRERGARQALKVQLDEQLRRREGQIDEDRLARQRGAEEQGAKQPPEAVDGEGDVERLVEALGVGGGKRLGGFLVITA